MKKAIIVTILLIVTLIGIAIATLRIDSMLCQTDNGMYPSIVIKNHAYIINKFSVGDNVEIAHFRSLRKGLHTKWVINDKHAYGDTIFSNAFLMGKSVNSPLYVVDDVAQARVIEN